MCSGNLFRISASARRYPELEDIEDRSPTVADTDAAAVNPIL
jgi:hypothetical protein